MVLFGLQRVHISHPWTVLSHKSFQWQELITNRRLPGGGSDSEVQLGMAGGWNLKQQAKYFFGKLGKLWQRGWQFKMFDSPLEKSKMCLLTDSMCWLIWFTLLGTVPYPPSKVYTFESMSFLFSKVGYVSSPGGYENRSLIRLASGSFLRSTWKP